MGEGGGYKVARTERVPGPVRGPPGPGPSGRTWPRAQGWPCRRRFKTWLTDEFRSTRVGWEDGTMLKAVMSGRSGYKVRGLLWCESTIPGRSKFVDRDLNAAINIRRCFIEECTAGRRARDEPARSLRRGLV